AGLADNALNKMHYDGYNLVRVIIETGRLSSLTGVGGPFSTNVPALDSQYMANVKDFLRKAQSHGIYVTFVIGQIPDNTYYTSMANAECPSTIGAENRYYLCPGWIKAHQAYVKEFVSEITTYDSSLLPTIFSYELANELFVTTGAPPFN